MKRKRREWLQRMGWFSGGSPPRETEYIFDHLAASLQRLADQASEPKDRARLPLREPSAR